LVTVRSVLIFEAASGATAEALSYKIAVFVGEATEALLGLVNLVVI
jgi:hypothetical protein